MLVRREITFLPITLSSQCPPVLLSLVVCSPLQAKSQTLEERREQAGGCGGAVDVRAEGNEGGAAATSRAREGRAQLRTGVGGRGGGRGFARGPGADRFGAGVGAVEAAGPHAGRPLARAWGGCRGQVRVGRLSLQQARFLTDSEKMADRRPAWLPDG